VRASDDDANETEAPTDWQAVDWQQASRRVRNLRQRIFRASREGDTRTVRSLQKLMLRSYSNTLVSVRRVTQDNAGRRTAGVDRVVITTPQSRAMTADKLQRHTQPWKAQPARRVYIPKASGKLRPLGIAMPSRRCLPPGLGIIRSSTGSGANTRAFSSARSSARNTASPRSRSTW
jgi:RNA-directed DNA polymerase